MDPRGVGPLLCGVGAVVPAGAGGQCEHQCVGDSVCEYVGVGERGGGGGVGVGDRDGGAGEEGEGGADGGGGGEGGEEGEGVVGLMGFVGWARYGIHAYMIVSLRR